MKSRINFDAGDTITAISTLFKVAQKTALGWLDAAGVAYTVAGKLQDACAVIEKHAYVFSGGKEVTINDPTKEKAPVEVYQEWSKGRITMTWGYSNGYKKPDWGHSVPCDALKTSNAAMRDEGKEIYNGNISDHGVWKFGRGKLGS